MLRKRFFLPLLVVPALLVYACSNQAEGERCDKQGENGGNDECQVGFVCTASAELAGSQVDRCCPPDRRAATVDICKPVTGVVTPTPDASTPDTSTPDTSTPDARGDADATAPDTGTDAAEAGSADAADEG